MNRTALPLATLGLAANLAFVTLGLATPKTNPGVLPPQSHPFSNSMSEWSAEWWQWVYSIPAEQSPLTDPTGQFSSLGQNGGPVFFLAGNSGGVTVRHCTVPAGKALFFPLLNQSWVQFPTDPPFTIPELRDIIAPYVDNPTLSCEIDGHPVQNLLEYRQQSTVFLVTLPDDNSLGLPAGTYGPCVDDGYYLMVAPLRPGPHLLHFTGAMSAVEFSLDVTYHLTVEAPQD